MFGYVVANQNALSPHEAFRYKSVYCGICRALRDAGGLKSTLALRYDLVFLALTLTSLYEPDEQLLTARCAVRPIKAGPQLQSKFCSYCADMGVALGYYKAMDDWQDDRAPAKLAAAKLLARPFAAAKQRWPRQCSAMQQSLAQLSQLEAQNCTDMDALCGSFGKLLGELFVYDEKDFWAGALRALGDALGRYLYLLDCILDFDEDVQKNRFNPLLGSELRQSTEWQQNALGLLLGETAAAFEHLPLVKDVKLLKNIVYSGLAAALPDHLRSSLENQNET
ncbi:MAG: hypothetical protein IJP01_02430 [Oscillospiraceae bacterium]|nr:hypothetical protein [Oscillospiraceae bacterium]